MPDFDDDVLGVGDHLVLCQCFGDRMLADEARRSGCYQPGGCPELRAAIGEEVGDLDA
jgi:hypothetical protein